MSESQSDSGALTPQLPREVRRANAIRLRIEGFTIREIAEELDTPRSTVSSWLSDPTTWNAIQDALEARRNAARQTLVDSAGKAAETLVAGLDASSGVDGDGNPIPDYRERRHTATAVLDRAGVTAQKEAAQHLHLHAQTAAEDDFIDATDEEAAAAGAILRQMPPEVE